MKTPRQTHRQSSSAPSSPVVKRSHICSICAKAFLTGSHLTRHERVHSSERKHLCPFPGCDVRCSRKDNLQQHYRIHLSPGSRRRTGRVIMLEPQPRQRSPSPTPPSPSQREDSPPLTPPPLADSRFYYLRIGVITQEEFEDVPVNIDLPVSPQPKQDRWHPSLLPPIDTSTTASSRDSSSPVPLTSSASAGASPYWGRASSTHSSPLVRYHPYSTYSHSFDQPYAVHNSHSYSEDRQLQPHPQPDVLPHVPALQRVLDTENSLGLSVDTLSPPIQVHAPAPTRHCVPLFLVAGDLELTPAPSPTPVDPTTNHIAVTVSPPTSIVESPQIPYQQNTHYYYNHIQPEEDLSRQQRYSDVSSPPYSPSIIGVAETAYYRPVSPPTACNTVASRRRSYPVATRTRETRSGHNQEAPLTPVYLAPPSFSLSAAYNWHVS
ncbi:hypothetical protein MIND_01367800 [Mycena indigotica]|uniref:C2H2-type domain-containing protein n=1 Tax=Mycena indigotica TaxID=2126181 RepID=A0A8H6S084_9AGAR|nr:uncharacterized protein MIND_01367800 [Mycena indigotica]KAF7289928.1 hypothetical protein MIND_01367800 [Mycena indigotica]